MGTEPRTSDSLIDVTEGADRSGLLAMIKELAMDAAQARADAARMAGLLRATRRTRDYAFVRTRSLHARCRRSEKVLDDLIQMLRRWVPDGTCPWCPNLWEGEHGTGCPYAIAIDLIEHPAANDELEEIKEAREWLQENQSPSTSPAPSPASEPAPE